METLGEHPSRFACEASEVRAALVAYVKLFRGMAGGLRLYATLRFTIRYERWRHGGDASIDLHVRGRSEQGKGGGWEMIDVAAAMGTCVAC